MKRTLQIWGALILILFLFPVSIQFVPSGEQSPSTKLVKEPSYIVYASNVTEEIPVEQDRKKALLYFTHTTEAYSPVTKEKGGIVAVNHQTENITKFGEKLQLQLNVNGIETDILPVNNALEMSKQKIPHGRAYKSIRPYVEQKLQEKDYDLIIDLHRDDPPHNRTTITYNDESFAKIAFVIGMEHPNYKKNYANAAAIKEELELLVPGITRHIVEKQGVGVDGKYNQDLHPNLLVVELGGIENTEEELNRSIAVIAEAVANAFEKDTLSSE